MNEKRGFGMDASYICMKMTARGRCILGSAGVGKNLYVYMSSIGNESMINHSYTFSPIPWCTLSTAATSTTGSYSAYLSLSTHPTP